VSYTCKPAAGVAIAVRSAVVILGIKNPFVVLVISSAAEAALAAVVVPTYNFVAFCSWAKLIALTAIRQIDKNMFLFFILLLFNCYLLLLVN
jgi:hypothetical protein